MRCPDCNKFVSYDEADPEVNTLEVDDDGTVRAEVRIVNNCSECSTELTEITFDMEAEHDPECFKDHQGDGHELQIEDNGSERTSRSGNFVKGKFVPKFGRYAKTFYGASVNYSITCSCGKLEAVDGSIEDEVQASGMEALV